MTADVETCDNYRLIYSQFHPENCPVTKINFSNWKKIFLQLEKNIFPTGENIFPIGGNIAQYGWDERPARAKAQWLQSITLLPLQGVYRNNI